MPTAGCAAAIRILPNDVISRIAAGEVIERPAGVVKELVENSLDAGGEHISIDVKDGGATLIRVTDDGVGMRRTDLTLAFERHATSKLRSDEDLTFIVTMGFRGEALPSIAAVSKVTATSATRMDSIGAQLAMMGGTTQAVTDAPPVPGTKIEVSDLFYNQPARKKFLRSTATEFSHISHVVQQAALAWPAVHFRLTHNGQEVLNYPGVTSDRDRILQVYRPAFLERAVEVKGRVAGCALHGFVVDPVQARSVRVPQDLFVNRRPVKNATVFHAVTEGYGSLLPKGRHPTYVLFLSIDPDRIDVNVHPTKQEIRFAVAEPIHQLIRQTLRHTLSGPERAMVLGLSGAGKSSPPSSVPAQMPDQPTFTALSPQRNVETGSGSSISGKIEELELGLVREPDAGYVGSVAADIVPLGQMLRRYLIAQVGEELQVIDQHTAHERVLFQRLWRRWESRTIASQPLLIPEPVELSAGQHALVRQHIGELESLGLVIEPFGGTSVAIRAVPVGLGKLDATALVHDLLEELAQWNRATSMEARVQPVLASLACHSAVRAGRAMALPEIHQLIRDWTEEGLIMTCPHGRRTAFRLAADELDKLFGRAGWS